MSQNRKAGRQVVLEFVTFSNTAVADTSNLNQCEHNVGSIFFI